MRKPTDGYVDNGYASICTVHCSEHVEVIGQVEPLLKWLSEITMEIDFAPRFRVRFKQVDGLTQDLPEIRPLDLIDVEEVRLRGVRSLSGCLYKEAWLRSKAEPESTFSIASVLEGAKPPTKFS